MTRQHPSFPISHLQFEICNLRLPLNLAPPSFYRKSQITNRKGEAAFSVLELTVALTLFLLITAAALGLLNTYQDAYFIQDRLNADQEQARRCLETIKGDLQESSFNWVFSDFSTSNTSPRSWKYDFGYRQCSNGSCPWMYKTAAPFGYIFPNRYLWAYKWTMGDTLCPICGSASTLSTSHDVLALYSPRDNPALGRDFMHLDEQGAPVWRSVIFYFPYYDGTTGQAQLRRAQLYLSDIDSSSTKNFGDLLTFTEGNSHQHLSFAGGRDGTDNRYWFYVYLHRQSADGTKNIYFFVRQSSSWTTNAYLYIRHPNVNNGAVTIKQFSREQKVIGTHVVDVDFSTSLSNSVSGTTIDPLSVRVTLATQSMPLVRQLRTRTSSPVRPLTTVLSTVLHPRN